MPSLSERRCTRRITGESRRPCRQKAPKDRLVFTIGMSSSVPTSLRPFAPSEIFGETPNVRTSAWIFGNPREHVREQIREVQNCTDDGEINTEKYRVDQIAASRAGESQRIRSL